MTGKTIGQLTAATSLDLTELVEIEQGGVSKKAPLSLMVATLNTVEVGADYTLGVNDSNIIITTTAACILTIPVDLSKGKKISIIRSLSAITAITTAASGSETIEGSASFITHGTFESLTYNGSEVTLEKITSMAWKVITLPVIKVEYSNQTVTAASTALKYTTKVVDTHAAYDISTGRFTAPMSGTYNFIPLIRSSTTSYGRIGLYKGGVLQYYIGNTPNANLINSPLPGEIYLVKGEYIDFRAIDYGLTASADDRIQIRLVSF